MKTSDVELGFLALPDRTPAPGVVMIHDVWGLSDHTRDYATRLAREGFAVLAIDLYRRDRPEKIEDPGRWMRALSDPQVLSDLGAGARFLASQSETNGRVGVLGFCMGGMYALMAGCADLGFAASVPFYGLLSHGHGILHDPNGLDPATKPREPIAMAAELRCPLLAFFGDQDTFIPEKDVEALRRELARARAKWELVVVPGAGHAFMNDTRPDAYRPEAAVEAWRRTVGFLRAQLGGLRPRANPAYNGRASTSASVRSRVAKRVTLHVTGISRPRLSTSEDSKRRGSQPSVIASSSVHHEACRALGTNAIASTPSSASRAMPSSAPAAGFASTIRPESASSARKPSATRSIAALTARRLACAAPLARRTPVDWRSRATNACWSGRSADSIASPCGAPAAAAAPIQPSSSAEARRSWTRRPSSAGSAGRPLASAAAAQLRKRRSSSASALAGCGAALPSCAFRSDSIWTRWRIRKVARFAPVTPAI